MNTATAPSFVFLRMIVCAAIASALLTLVVATVLLSQPIFEQTGRHIYIQPHAMTWALVASINAVLAGGAALGAAFTGILYRWSLQLALSLGLSAASLIGLAVAVAMVN